MLSTEFVASDQWALNNQSWPTTLWATNATISAAILLGPIYGMLSGVVIVAASTLAKGVLNYDLGRNATVVIELAVGLGVGMAAQTARRAHTDLERAARLAARTRNENGCPGRCTTAPFRCLRWCPAVVARSAVRQRNWRSWPGSRSARCAAWSARRTPNRGIGELTDIGALLRQRASDRVSVSVPADPVLLDGDRRRELAAAAGNALDNAAAHAGPDARAYVLLEDLGDTVTVSIRDDGVGIADGRLEEAVGEGRFGIAKSIVGRMNWLGGSAKLNTGPGCGTEWELTIPRR